jgi:hypothetical protein
MRGIKKNMSLDKTLKYLVDNWTIIGLLISGIVVLVLSIIKDFISEEYVSKNIYSIFLYAVGSCLVLTLFEMHSCLKKKNSPFSDSDCYESMSDAEQEIFKKLLAHLKKKRNSPVELRIYGMRLSAIRRVLCNFLEYSKKENIVNKKLVVHVFHCAPKYMSNIENENDRLKESVRNLFILQIKELEVIIKQLKKLPDSYPLLKAIDFKEYFSLPSFWAYEIDREDVFWGYFTWDKTTKNWIGPENKCFYFNQYNQPINGLVDWIHNQFDGLETWSFKS